MINMFLKSLALREFVTATIETDANPRLHVISSFFKVSFNKQNSLFYRNTFINIFLS